MTTAEKILGEKIEYSGNYTTFDGEVIVVEGLPKKPNPEPVHVRTWADDKNNMANYRLPNKSGYDINICWYHTDHENGKTRIVSANDVPDWAKFNWEQIRENEIMAEWVDNRNDVAYTYVCKYICVVPEAKGEATGDCVNCKHIQCSRRGNGIKCRNFREKKE